MSDINFDEREYASTDFMGVVEILTGIFRERGYACTEFWRVAEEITGILRGGTEISPDMVPEIVSEAMGGRDKFNCYPGVPGSCHRVAFFVSLQAKRFRKRWPRGAKHLSFSQALARLVKHMQGTCPDITTKAILIADTWDVDSYQSWKANLRRINHQYHLEIYFIGSGNAMPIPL